MKAYSNWSVRAKLVLPVFLVLAVGGGFLAGSIFQKSKTLREHSMQLLLDATNLRRASQQMLGDYREFALNASPDIMEHVVQSKKEFLAQLDEFVKHVEHDNQHGNSQLEKIANLVTELISSGDCTDSRA